jgi:hypothetical protein
VIDRPEEVHAEGHAQHGWRGKAEGEPGHLGRQEARPPLAHQADQLIGEKKALERGFHGAWRPPLRGGVQNDWWPWGADRPAEQPGDDAGRDPPGAPGDRAGVEVAPFDEDHAHQDAPDQAPQPARGQGRQPPHPDRRAHEGPAQECRQRRGHEVTAQLQGQDQAEDRTVHGDERDGQRRGHEEGQEGQRHQPEAKPRQPEHAARQCQDAGSRQPRQAHATPFHHARPGRQGTSTPAGDQALVLPAPPDERRGCLSPGHGRGQHPVAIHLADGTRQDGLNIEKLSYAATCEVSVEPNTLR